MVIKRFEIWRTNLEPVKGSEISKTRPCVVISPDVSNKYLNTVTIAAMTTSIKTNPTRVDCTFKAKKGQVALDQIRSVDKTRLIKRLGILDEDTNKNICKVLIETFSY